MHSNPTQFTQKELKQAELDLKKKSLLEADYRPFKKLVDPRFGEISILKSRKGNELIFFRETKEPQKAGAVKLAVLARREMLDVHAYLLPLLDFAVEYESQLCSAFYNVRYYHEYPRSDLKKESQDRAKKSQEWSDADLIHILYQQLAALGHLHRKGHFHGDVNPLLVAYDPVKNLTQLIPGTNDGATLPSLIGLQRRKVASGSLLYQSPQLFESICKGGTRFELDPKKEDAFALGLVLLELGTGVPVRELYEMSAKRFNGPKLAKQFEAFRTRFEQINPLLTSVVAILLQEDPKMRAGPLDLEGTIPSYDEIKAYFTQVKEGSLDGSRVLTQSMTMRSFPQSETVADVVFLDTDEVPILVDQSLEVEEMYRSNGQLPTSHLTNWQASGEPPRNGKGDPIQIVEGSRFSHGSTIINNENSRFMFTEVPEPGVTVILSDPGSHPGPSSFQPKTNGPVSPAPSPHSPNVFKTNMSEDRASPNPSTHYASSPRYTEAQATSQQLSQP